MARHTLTIEDSGSGSDGNNYKVVVDGGDKPEFVKANGATVDDDDAIYKTNDGKWAVQGTVNGGRDAFAYNGMRVRHVLQYPDRLRFKVNDKNWKPAQDYAITQRDDWPGESKDSEAGGGSPTQPSGESSHDRHEFTIRDSGGSEANSYKVFIDSDAKPEFVAINGATKNSNDNIYQNPDGDWVVHGQVYGGADAFLYDGSRVRHVVEFPDRLEFKINEKSWKAATNFDLNQRTDWPGEGDDTSGSQQPVDEDPVVSVPSVSDPVEIGDLKFDKVAHAVDDLGMDPSGGEDISARLEKAAGDHTLIKFPAGKFRLANQVVIEGLTHFGMKGVGPADDGTLIQAKPWFIDRLIVRDGTGLLFEGIGIDQRLDKACPGLWLSANDSLHVRNVDWHGRGIHPKSTFDADSGNPGETNALSVGVTSPDGKGLVEDYTCRNRGQMRNKHHGNSRIGIWGLNDHKGTLDFRNIDIRGCPNNGMYTSSCPGAIRVFDSTLKHNTVSQIRIATEGSVVKNCDIGFDADESEALDPMTPGHGTQGVACDSGKVDDGAAVIGCNIHMGKAAKGRGGIAVWGRSGSHVIKNCDITIDDDAISYGNTAMPAVSFERPDGTHSNTDVALRNTSLHGDALSGPAIATIGRNTVLNNVCNSQPRQLINAVDCSPEKSNVNEQDACPRRSGSGTGNSNGGSDDSGNGSVGSGGSDDSESDAGSNDGDSTGDGKSSDDSSDDGSSGGGQSKDEDLPTTTVEITGKDVVIEVDGVQVNPDDL